MNEITRAEHVRWAKARALEYADRGDHVGAIASLLSDFDKHDETRALVELVAILGHAHRDDMRSFIEGFSE